MMHPLLRFALAACPADYRREYRESISADVQMRGVSVGAAALDVIYQGLAMRGENITRDVSFGLRSLRKSPLFVSIAVVTIALAIGANVAAATLVRGVLLQPLPYTQPDRLTFIGGTFRGQRSSNIDYPDVHDFSQRNKTFSAIAVATQMQATLTGIGRPENLNGVAVGAAYFKILREQPQLGRLLDKRDLGTANIVISDAFWRSKFGSNAAVLGRRITINDRPHTIVGVGPRDFVDPGPGFMLRSDYWQAIDPRDRYSTGWRGFWAYEAVGRLKTGVSFGAAQSDLSRIAAALAREYPKFDRGRGVYVESMTASVVGPYRDVLLMIYGAALLVLFIAAVNIANMLLARAGARCSEMAVREALGATRSRIAAQIATETSMLVIAALAVGIALASFALAAIRSALPAVYPSDSMLLPGLNHLKIDGPVAGYTAAVALIFIIGVSVVPAMTRRTGGVREGGRLRRVLVIVEIVVACALLAIAGLWVRSFFAIIHAPAGFTEANVYSVQVGTLPSDRYGSTHNTLAFTQRVERRLRSLPGVRGAASVLVAGIGDNDGNSTNYSVTQTADKAGVSKFVKWNAVSPGFFRMLDIPLLRGRAFAASNGAHSLPVAIVSSRFAQREFGSTAAAIGRYVSVGQSSGGGFPMRRIIGVVGNVRHGLSDPPDAEVYVPIAQVTFFQKFIVRTAGHDASLGREIDGAIARIDPLLPPPTIMSFESMRALDAAATRTAAAVFLILAAVALLLAFAGIYGVVAYSVSRRTREFGIRMALGGTRAGIAASVMRRTIMEAAIGVAIGLVLAALAGRALGENLYQTAPFDPLTLLVSAAVLLASSALAALVPTLRATAQNPAAALHVE